MEEYNRYVRIAHGDHMKLARMLEIQSWFDNKDQLAAMAASMDKYLQQSKKTAILPEGVTREYIELLLGHGANKFTKPDREGAVVGVLIPDGASTRG